MAFRHALIAVFVAVILAPLTANMCGLDGGNPVAENRRMAPVPALEPTVDALRALPAGFTAWFEDHFGFRSALVRASGEFRYRMLGVSPSASVVKGRDGWLYYGSDSGMDDYVRAFPFSDADLTDWRDSLERSERWLAARGTAFVFSVSPDKHVIYPEYVPDTIRPMGRVYPMDQLQAALAGSGIAVVDVRPALFAAKGRERLYEKTDTHWNERGAYVAYVELIGAIRAQVPAVPPAWSREDFFAEERDEDAMDLAGMIGLRDVLREQRLLLRPRRARLARTLEPEGGEPWWGSGRIVTEIPGSTLPRAVVFRDSFLSRVAPFLSEHFSRVVYLWQTNFDVEYVETEKPDVVVQQIASRHLLSVRPYSNAP